MKSSFGFGVAKGAGIILNNFSRAEENFGGTFFLACQPKEGLDSRDGGGFPNPFPS